MSSLANYAQNQSTQTMKNLITSSNFADNKVKIMNSVSTFGKINAPESWSIGLHIFDFENEQVEDMVSSFLIDEFFGQMSDRKSI